MGAVSPSRRLSSLNPPLRLQLLQDHVPSSLCTSRVLVFFFPFIPLQVGQTMSLCTPLSLWMTFRWSRYCSTV